MGTRILRFPGLIVVAGIVLMVGVYLRASAVPSNDEKPSAEFLAAALRAQVNAATIDVDFTLSEKGAPDANLRYVRSPSTQYMSREEDGNRGFCLFDRTRKKGRKLILEDGKKDGWVQADISGMPFQMATWPDPVLNMLQIGYLVDAIDKGTVADLMEKQDGHDCWRVDIRKDTGKMVMEFSIWLDPDVGFCPRRIERLVGDHRLVCSMTDYKDIGEGVWFPMHTRWESPDIGPHFLTEAKVKTAKAISDTKTLKLDTKFPSGTKVKDTVIGGRYTVP